MIIHIPNILWNKIDNVPGTATAQTPVPTTGIMIDRVTAHVLARKTSFPKVASRCRCKAFAGNKYIIPWAIPTNTTPNDQS